MDGISKYYMSMTSWVAVNLEQRFLGLANPASKFNMNLSDRDRDNLECLEQFAEAATNAIHKQRRDIDHVTTTIDRLENEFRGLRGFVYDLHRKIIESSHHQATFGFGNGYSIEDYIGADRLAESSKSSGTSQGCLDLPLDEIEDIRQNFVGLDRKIQEVKNLKLDVHLLKARLRHVEEDTKRSSTPRCILAKCLTPGHPLYQQKRVSDPVANKTPALHEGDESTDTGVLKNKESYMEREPSISENRKEVLYPASSSAKAGSMKDPPSVIDDHDWHGSVGSPSSQDVCRYREDLSSEHHTFASTIPNCYNPSSKESGEYSSASVVTTDPLDTRSSPSIAEPDPISSSHRRTRRSRRRSGGLRDANGVRITKSGRPDRRAGNYKYLKAYYDNLKAEREKKESKPEPNTEDHEEEQGNEETLQVEETIEDGLVLANTQLQRRHSLESIAVKANGKLVESGW